jgi:hypothetical protein
MKMKSLYTTLAAFILVAAASLGVLAAPAAEGQGSKQEKRAEAAARVRTPLNLAVLIQDDLVPRVGNELKITGEFIRSLPAGSTVMVGYIRAGSLQVRQAFTNDLDAASRALRIPVGSTAVSPFNPYVEVREALRLFPEGGSNRNALLLVSDGLDASRGLDFTSSVNSIDLDRAVREAKKRNVSIYSFYAPSVGLTSYNRRAISFGQSALNRISDETGGKAFFQGSSFVTFNAYFDRLSRTLNEQQGGAY